MDNVFLIVQCSKILSSNSDDLSECDMLSIFTIVYGAMYAEKLKEKNAIKNIPDILICEMTIFLMLYTVATTKKDEKYKYDYMKKTINCLSEIYDLDINVLEQVFENRSHYFALWTIDNSFANNYESIIELEYPFEDFIMYKNSLTNNILDLKKSMILRIQFSVCLSEFCDNVLQENSTNIEKKKSTTNSNAIEFAAYQFAKDNDLNFSEYNPALCVLYAKEIGVDPVIAREFINTEKIIMENESME